MDHALSESVIKEKFYKEIIGSFSYNSFVKFHGKRKK